MAAIAGQTLSVEIVPGENRQSDYFKLGENGVDSKKV